MLDGLFVAALRQELNERLRTGRIATVRGVDRYTVVLEIRKQREVERLLLSADPEMPRVHLMETDAPNAATRDDTPSSFTMLLRKYLEGARVQAVTQPGTGIERILRLELDTRGPGGGSYPLFLIAELLGKKADLWLVEAGTGRILDSLRRQRGLAPDLPYTPPPSQEKVVLTPGCGAVLLERWRWLAASRQGEQRNAQAALVALVDGLGPLTAAEILHRAQISPAQPVPLVSTSQQQRLAEVMEQVAQQLVAGQFAPTLLWASPEGGEGADDPPTRPAADYCALRLTQYPPAQQLELRSPSQVLERFFAPRWQEQQLAKRRRQLERPVRTAWQQARRRLEKQEQELASAEQADRWRIFGELLLSQLAAVPAGATEVELDNYYTDPVTKVRIALDPSLSAAQNAQRYFHRYTRARRTQQAASHQAEHSRRQVEYLEGVLAELEWASTWAELDEIEAELQQAGLCSSGTRAGQRRPGGSPARKERAGGGKRHAPLPPRRYLTADGIEIWVGRNNRQNDRLSLKQAAPDDIWFHAHQIPGAHVILRCAQLPQVPDSSLLAAAQVAAYFSRGAGASHVPVDYTRCRHLRKPTGTAPGYVIYHVYKTVEATPSLEAVRPLPD
ncbi:MAG: NFACT family protein [Limnochordaceae bacterium]|nr:NFACT family protein [Limnochordaceae bacterium]